MAELPKGFRKKINFIKQNEGPEKRQDYLDEIDFKGMLIPKGIDYEDIDNEFVEFLKNDAELVINDEKVPIYFLTITKWGEFSKTWSFSDKYKNIKMPFITVVRQPDIQVGTNQAGNWNIPGKQLYTYIKVPNGEGGRKGIDTYKIPQPTSVDVTYDVRLFCNRMKDLNIYHRIIQKLFNSRQYYFNVKGHPMPIHLERISDESQKNDFQKRRFYVQHFQMLVKGYILDENDFEVIPSINRIGVKLFEQISNKNKINRVKYNISYDEESVVYDFIFKPNSLLEFTFTSDSNIQFKSISNINNITNIVIKINNIEVMNGLTLNNNFNISKGDEVTIIITTNNNTIQSLFKLIGDIQNE